MRCDKIYMVMIMLKKLKRIFIILICLCIVGGFCFYRYVNDFYVANEEVMSVVKDSKTVSMIDYDDYICFNVDNASAGLIFYPGAKIESEAYVPLMNSLASQGILCILLRVPFRLAIFDINGANGIMEKFGQVKSWYVGGHSLGGAMASYYIKDHAGEYDGLILLAAYSSKDISQMNLNVISIYGSEDKVLSLKKYEKYKSYLPDNYKEYIIEGGCHSYFGSYGIQDGDGKPTISNQKQIEETVSFIVENMY